MSVATRHRPAAREVALLVVRDVFADRPRGARESLDYRLRQGELDARDRALATELAYGAIRMRRWLDYQLAPYLDGRSQPVPRPIAEILRLGVYQLRCMTGIEPYAAVSESVGLARRYGHKGTAGLVNAVLRRVADAPPREAPGDDDDALALRASLPTWIVGRWRARFGSEGLAAILAAVNEPAAIGVRVDLRRASQDDVVAALGAAGIGADPSAFARDAVVLRGHVSSVELERLAAGRWEFQAEAACFPVDLLDPAPGARVFEACAGRGNKSLQLAARLGPDGRLETVEADPRRAEFARGRLAAAGDAPTTTIRVGDAAAEAGPADCDGVLVDAPCSGLGIIARQPEARWRKDPDDAARLAVTQRAILTAAAGRLRPGGALVYAVCSTDPLEGEAVVEELLAARPDLVRGAIPARYAPFLTAAGDVLVPPAVAGRDGFAIFRLVRAG